MSSVMTIAETSAARTFMRTLSSESETEPNHLQRRLSLRASQRLSAGKKRHSLSRGDSQVTDKCYRVVWCSHGDDGWFVGYGDNGWFVGYGVPMMTMDGLWGWCSHGDNGWFVGMVFPW